jgi:hypothetical protein
LQEEFGAAWFVLQPESASTPNQVNSLTFYGIWKTSLQTSLHPPLPPFERGVRERGFEFSPMEQKAKHPLASPFVSLYYVHLLIPCRG